MALLFICEHCGEEIIVERFKPGDKVVCMECGGHLTVPENALQTDAEPNNLAVLVDTGDLATISAGADTISRRMPEEERLPGGRLESLLGETFRFYKRHLLSVVAITAVPVTVQNILGRLFAPLVRANAGTSFADGIRLGIILLAFALAAVLPFALMHGALIHLVCQRYASGSVSVMKAFGYALARLKRLVAARLMVTVLLMIVGGVGFALFVLSGPVAGIAGLAAFVAIIFMAATLYLAVRWVFAEHAVLLEDCGAAEALARSEVRVKGHWWRIFGVFFLTLLLLAAVGTTISLLFTLILTPLRSLVVQLVVSPPLGIMTTLLYFDVRMRKEHYGRSQLAEALKDNAE
jgi:hypothetical protein